MQRTRKTLVLAMAMSIGLSSGAWAAGAEPFADLDNDGVFGPGDVAIAKYINNDGQFVTDRSEGDYKAPAGRVSVVFPARFVAKKRAVVVKASGDITVEGDISVSGNGSILFLLSTDGAVRVAEGVRLVAGDLVQLIGAHDVTVGDNVDLQARDNTMSAVQVASQDGDVTVGNACDFHAAGLIDLSTNDDVGGSVSVGPGTRLSGNTGDARITAGQHVNMEGVRLTARDILIGSQRSVRTAGRAARASTGMGPGYTAVRQSQLKSGGKGSVHIYAAGGDGSTIDLSDTAVSARKSQIQLDADIIVR